MQRSAQRSAAMQVSVHGRARVITRRRERRCIRHVPRADSRGTSQPPSSFRFLEDFASKETLIPSFPQQRISASVTRFRARDSTCTRFAAFLTEEESIKRYRDLRSKIDGILYESIATSETVKSVEIWIFEPIRWGCFVNPRRVNAFKVLFIRRL